SAELPELLAHELEHVVEQIERLDLVRLSRVRDSGVYRIEGNRFETLRAQAAGPAARQELETIAIDARRQRTREPSQIPRNDCSSGVRERTVSAGWMRMVGSAARVMRVVTCRPSRRRTTSSCVEPGARSASAFQRERSAGSPSIRTMTSPRSRPAS